MKVVEWFKNVLYRFRKKDYMLDENLDETQKQEEKKDFVPKVDVDSIKKTTSREDILISMRDDVMVQHLAEEYSYGKFRTESIRYNYDKDGILSDEDNTALSCLYGAIRSGNHQEFKGEEQKINNKINTFLEESPRNIIILVNLMIREAENLYEKIMSDSEILKKPMSIQELIPASYEEISRIIEEYNKVKSEELMQ